MQIVLVDPSRTVRRIISDLVQHWNYEVHSCSDGIEALSYIQHNNNVRVLITSSVLPSMSGADLCARARLLVENRRPLYIIVMSSTDEYSKCVQMLDMGADEFIRKPPIAQELRARLSTADRVTSMQCELVRLARTDDLTGLPNRRAFFEYVADIIAQAQNRHAVSAIMFDLDHFKQVNDMYGHDVGDTVLKRVAAELTPLHGFAGRLGGEEFALLMEGDLSDAVEIAQKFRHDIEKLGLFDGERPVAVTCSAGVAEWEAGDTIDTLLRRADVAMYEAKRTGRNKVVAADSYALSEQHDRWRGTARVLSRTC